MKPKGKPTLNLDSICKRSQSPVNKGKLKFDYDENNELQFTTKLHGVTVRVTKQGAIFEDSDENIGIDANNPNTDIDFPPDLNIESFHHSVSTTSSSTSSSNKTPTKISPKCKLKHTNSPSLDDLIDYHERSTLLGSGASGTVVQKVLKLDNNKKYALKSIELYNVIYGSWLNEEKTKNETTETYVTGEMELLQMYRKDEHNYRAHLLAIVNVYLDKSTFYVLMEYMSRGSMMDLIKSLKKEFRTDEIIKMCRFSHKKTMSPFQLINTPETIVLPELALAVFADGVLKALKYIHSKKMVHRDIKPSNILVDSNGCVKVADFGIVGCTAGGKQLQTPIGTMGFRSPESIKGEPYGEATDIWALGITILYGALGHHPFDHLDPITEFSDNSTWVNSNVRFPVSCSEAFMDFCLQCLNYDPLYRPKAADLSNHQFVKTASDFNLRMFYEEKDRIKSDNLQAQNIAIEKEKLKKKNSKKVSANNYNHIEDFVLKSNTKKNRKVRICHHLFKHLPTSSNKNKKSAQKSHMVAEYEDDYDGSDADDDNEGINNSSTSSQAVTFRSLSPRKYNPDDPIEVKHTPPFRNRLIYESGLLSHEAQRRNPYRLSNHDNKWLNKSKAKKKERAKKLGPPPSTPNTPPQPNLYRKGSSTSSIKTSSMNFDDDIKFDDI